MRLSYHLTIGIVAALGVPLTASAEQFSFVAIGDTPYRVPAQYAHFERLTARINTLQPAFTIHVGDIKNGNSRCDDEVFVRMHAMLNAFAQPLVYTPGDNEWTDCHRANNGSFDPLERLDRLRSLFFARPGSLGRNRMPLEHQSADPKYAKFAENTRWEKGGVQFATLHVIGSNNNLQRDQAAVHEYLERNAANLAWLRSTFLRAMEHNARAVVIAFQADPGWELGEDQRSGFTDTLQALRAAAVAFGKPVLVIHGDKHRLVIDKPLHQGRQLIYNVTRLMVFGDSEVQGVVVGVDSEDPDVFSFRTMTVPENLADGKPAT